MKTAITAASCLTPGERIIDPVVIIQDGLVETITSRAASELPAGCEVLDFPGAIIAPGFVDIHIHGGAGHDVMEGTPEAFGCLGRFLATHGVTSYLPTTVTAPIDTLLAALDGIAAVIESERGEGARPVGIHLEGPFISDAKRGVHPRQFIQPPSIKLFERFWQASRGHIKLMTIAPELPGAIELIAEAVRRGVCVSMGHSDAERSATLRGIEAGARHATHTFNAMRVIDHRDPGIAGTVLANEISAEIIADGIHVSPAMVDLFLRCKGRDRAVLVTDAISATGMPDGRYPLGSFEIEVRGDTCLSSEGKLAGSVLTLDRAVRNVMNFAGWTLEDAVLLATINPASTIGLHNVGRIASGLPADIAVLSPRGDVLDVFCRGCRVGA